MDIAQNLAKNITHVSKKSRGMFSVSDTETDKIIGIMTYQCMDDTCFVIDHTEVDEAYNGQGYETALILGAVDFARENNKKIIPICPFVKAYFKRNPEVCDVLFK